MPKCEFAVGDVVRLKSGGPSMTVADVEGVVVTTAWVDFGYDARGVSMSAACFEKVPAEPVHLSKWGNSSPSTPSPRKFMREDPKV